MNLDQINPDNYNNLLEDKKNKLLDLFKDFSTPDLEVFESPKLHYRMRAEFRVWQKDQEIYFYMFDNETKQRVRIDQFLPASKIINDIMIDLLNEIRNIDILRTKLFEVDFLSTKSNELLVTLIYHRQLKEDWIDEARKLKDRLSQKYKINIIGRARKLKISIDEDFVIEKLTVDNQEYIYKQVENSFTQPNADVAIKMLEWARDLTKNATGDLLELYCGNGNFSIALADRFKKVLATELAASSVAAAQYNIKANGVSNLDILKMSAEDFSNALKGTREFFRLKDFDLKSYNCNTILVDPPRSGLDDTTLELVSSYENIIYISCNPNTLVENLKYLTKTHKITRFALFDQFPYTDHMESGVYLQKI